MKTAPNDHSTNNQMFKDYQKNNRLKHIFVISGFIGFGIILFLISILKDFTFGIFLAITSLMICLYVMSQVFGKDHTEEDSKKLDKIVEYAAQEKERLNQGKF